MRFLMVTECRVPMDRMQRFTTLVQQWEQDAMDVEGGPEMHAVYLHERDPSVVMIVTQFASREEAERFEATGLVARFHEHVLACTDHQPLSSAGYDLYYAASAEGRRIMFGEEG